jgi:glycosyltransferase involved in cell wall biosynthesis
MKQSGHYDVRIATLVPGGVLAREAEGMGFIEVPAYRLTSFYDWNMARQLWRCAAMLRSSRISVIHTHDFYSNVFGMMAGFLAQVPLRIASRRELGAMRTPAQLWVERQAYSLAHAVVANSAAVQRQLLREGVPEHKIHIVHNGLNPQRVSPPANKDRQAMLGTLGLPFAANAPLVTIVANLRHEVKDIPTFLRAAQRVKTEMPDAGFVIAGEGELLDELRGLAAQLKVDDRVVFLGPCRNIAELLTVSTVCVLSSKSEGFSNAILEYMAAGKPVVATDVGGAREAIIEGETGYLVEAGDNAAMAESIVGLLRNPAQAHALGERGHQVVKERFSCAAQLLNTEQLYTRLLRSRGELFQR